MPNILVVNLYDRNVLRRIFGLEKREVLGLTGEWRAAWFVLFAQYC
jgi:hypothetical protein